ncbi:MAG: AbrB/MazE/SpoVT family DNA-binding domain-containing protein [Bryobacterales bacterium]|nr:AbrB/MazE/SpoVT family DNA-binding domain-containing protein [Bryobacterales bacterium]
MWKAARLGFQFGRYHVNRRRRTCVIILLESYQLETTRLSTKGQIILPRSIRLSRGWLPGVEFTVEETGDGVLLRPKALFPETDLDQVAGCLRSSRKSKTSEQMRAAVRREVMRRHDSGRY